MSTILSDVFQYFKNGLKVSKAVRGRLEELGFDLEKLQEYGLEFGYNSGQFHHREKKEKYPPEKCILKTRGYSLP